jgi:transposase
MANTNKEHYFFSEQKYICFLTSCQNAIRLTGIPEYTSRYSRRDYTQPQLLALLVFKEYLGERYRDFVQLVEIMNIVQDQLELKEIPHYSTLCKFSKRISSTVLNQLFRKACSFMSEWKHVTTIVAIDSSGFTPDSASIYYSDRTGKIRHDYLKTTISVDSDHISLLAFQITNSRRHDSQIAPSMLRASHRVRKAECYVMDKAYDSERIHQVIHEDLQSQSMIPVRDWHASYVSGKYRQVMADSFDKKIYGQRNMAETAFSILKRVFGDIIHARSYRQQVKEIKLKCIVFSIDRFLKHQRVFNVF